jgi:uncharacterized protein YndB with AHSA1/START domain
MVVDDLAAEEIDDLFRPLAEPTRRDILRRCVGGEPSVSLWRVTAIDPPTSLQFTDAFADTDGTPVADMPVSTVRVELTGRHGGTRMEMQPAFESREDMEKVVNMATVEGLQQAVSQMDAVLDS